MISYCCSPGAAGKGIESEREACVLVTGIREPARIRAVADHNEPEWMQRPLFSHLYLQGPGTLKEDGSGDQGIGAGQSSSDGAPNLRAVMNTLRTVRAAAGSSSDEMAEGTAVEAVTRALLRRLGGLLALPSDADLDPARPIRAFGIDSLVAIDLRNWIAKEAGADVAIFDIMNAKSATEMARLMIKRSRYLG